jgi:hypothetical protein
VGLLHPDGEVSAFQASGWQRLGCAGGSVLVRRTPLGLALLPG